MDNQKKLSDQFFKQEKKSDRSWAVRHSLLRDKPMNKVIPAFLTNGHVVSGIILDETHPPEHPYDCPDACLPCFYEYFPAAVGVTDSEAKEIVTALVADARRDLDFLRKALADHANFIVTRWKKKSREKRSAFLSANVDLFDKKFAAVHLLHMCSRPGNSDITSEVPRSVQDIEDLLVQDFLRDLLHTNKVKELTSGYQDTWLLPYLDSEMLSEDPTLLLSLLHYRTVYEPERWVLFDDLHVDLAERFAVITQTFNPHCVVMHGPDFGKLVNWSAEEAHRYEIIGFTKAHNILVVQQRMMAFLRKCVAGLLGEAKEPPVLKVHPKWAHLINIDFSRFDSTYAWSTESVKPFSSPPNFDPVETVELIRSRHRVIKDHVELLQTDPAYVQQLARELKSALFFETFQNEMKWPYLVDKIFRDSLVRECWWRQLVVESDRIVVAWRAFVESPSESTRMAYDQSIICVQMYCIEMFVQYESFVDGALLYQPGFERNFEFLGDGKRNPLDRQYTTRDFFPDDILYWSVTSLGHDKYRPFTMDPSLNFTVIDYLCRTSPKEAERLSQDLLDQFSDMAVLNSIINNTRCYHLHDRNRKQEFLVGDQLLRKDFVSKINSPVGQELGDITAKHLYKFCTNHPWPKGTKNEEWLKQATESRESLGNFWKVFRSTWAEILRANGVKQSLINEDLNLMQAAQSEAHFADIVGEEEDVRYQENKRRTKGRSSLSMDVQTVWGKIDESSPLLPVRSKKKRRQESESLETLAQLPSAVQKMQNEPPTMSSLIPVKHDNLAIFHHMFPSCGEGSSRCFSWQHFLSAMVDAGFSIFQSQGSAVTFRMNEEKDEGVRTIVVHRPHPSPTINPVMLRCIAKRMTKWFGWKREIFTVRAREKKEEIGRGSDA